MKKRIVQYFMTCFFISAFPLLTISQTTSYNQLCNELQLARTINDKWAAEIFLGGTFSSTPSESRVIKTNIQRYVSGWAHYYLSPRWKLTSGLAYYYNKDVPDIGQYYSPEWRISLQGIYFIHKTGFTLSTRMRGEMRIMKNEDGNYEDKYRYRQMIKYLQPLNGKVLRKGVVYLYTTEELLFKPKAKTEGVTFFDRNRFEIGAGYLFTDNIQVELAYLNEFMPRDDYNEMYNALEITLIFNNPLTNLKNTIFPKPAEADQSE
jgi:hypothetical protein